jgi:hypothetical protein
MLLTRAEHMERLVRGRNLTLAPPGMLQRDVNADTLVVVAADLVIGNVSLLVELQELRARVAALELERGRG